MARKRRPRSNKKYFTIIHEQAIVSYCKTQEQAVKDKLYTEYIYPIFTELIDKIVFAYKFNTLPNIDSLKEDCKEHLTTILYKYDPDRGSKAFSYFSVVAKNWFIQKIKKNSKRVQIEVPIQEVIVEHNDTNLIVYNNSEEFWEKEDFIDSFWEEMARWDDGELRPNEERILDAIQELIKDADSIDIFNKRSIYLYLRELTGLNTKQVVSALSRLRVKYRLFNNKWKKGKI